MSRDRILSVKLLLSLVVILLGAYTRLKDAGLGCPDWPGCYGYAFMPTSEAEIQEAEASFPLARPVVTEKALPEMVHRYLAGFFGLLCVSIAAYHIAHKKHRVAASFLAVLIAFQATLGLWTVTLKLHPVVVLLHLFGGFSISTILLWLLLGNKRESTPFDKWAFLILGVILTQVFFGAWTSANYSSIICPDFPFCQGSLLPEMSFSTAFNIFLPFGDNYEFGILDNISRVTIHMTHRYFAVITSFGIITFLYMAYYSNAIKLKTALLVLSILSAQVLLGILNILYLIPIPIALAHNIGGLLLLLSWIWLTHSLSNNHSTT